MIENILEETKAKMKVTGKRGKMQIAETFLLDNEASDSIKNLLVFWEDVFAPQGVFQILESYKKKQLNLMLLFLGQNILNDKLCFGAVMNNYDLDKVSKKFLIDQVGGIINDTFDIKD